MKNLLIVFMLGLFAMATAPTQSMANVADKQQHAVVITSQVGDASTSSAIDFKYSRVPEVASMTYQLVDCNGLLADASIQGDVSKVTDTSTSSVTDTSTDSVTDAPLVPDDTPTGSGILNLLKSNWAELLLGLLALIKIFVRITPSIKDDAVFGKIDNFISWIVPNLQVKK